MVQITTVHRRYDTRIYEKEVKTLSARFGRIALLVRDGHGDITDAQRQIFLLDGGPPGRSRLWRMTLGVWDMFRRVSALHPAVAHFHDPELIPIGLALKMRGIKVVYDVHENVPAQIQSKDWVPPMLRRPLACCVDAIERVAAQQLDAIVAATPTIASRFPRDKTVTVQNFPTLAENTAEDPPLYDRRSPHFAYVGEISAIRGAYEMVQALHHLEELEVVRLELAGAFQPADVGAYLKSMPGWDKVIYHGWAGRNELARILANARAGLVVSHPTRNNLDAYPVKMFEYMAAGIPVIASDIPLWRQIVETAGCGLLVDPLRPEQIAAAMRWMLSHPAEAEDMGRRGRLAILQQYNWERESVHLVGLYTSLLGRKPASSDGT